MVDRSSRAGFRRRAVAAAAICADKKILFCLAPPGRKVSADVAAAFKASLKRLEALGAELEEMPGDGFDVEPIWRAINHTVWRTRFEKLAAEHGDELSETFLRQLALARKVSGVDYQQAMFDRTTLFRRVQSLLQRADLLAMPTITRTALPIEQDLFGTIEIDGEVFDDVRPNWFPWTMPFNMTGHPAVSMPCGFGADGLPIGLQLVGQFRGDAELLRVSALFEAAQNLSIAGRTRHVATFGKVNSIECRLQRSDDRAMRWLPPDAIHAKGYGA